MNDERRETSAVPGTEAKESILDTVAAFVNATPNKPHPIERLLRQIDQGLVECSRELFNDALQTMVAKNQDYAGSDEPEKAMRNFKFSAEIAHIKMSQGILNRLMDKITRIGNILESGEIAVKSESIFDTLQDTINYTAILYYGILIETKELMESGKPTEIDPPKMRT
jgi:hypothetical protein